MAAPLAPVNFEADVNHHAAAPDADVITQFPSCIDHAVFMRCHLVLPHL
jgi:hypothetical protein